MENRVLLFLMPLMLSMASGCSQPESPHFVPATADTSKATPTNRQGPAKPTGEVAPMIKIEMH